GFNRYNNTVGNTAPPTLSENAQYNTRTIWTNTLKYSNEFGAHNLSVLVGSEALRNYGRSVGGGVTGLFSTDFNFLQLGNGTSNVTNFSSAYVNALFSLFSRVDYSFNDKYLLGLTVRRDGSSKFGSKKRYGVFPSVSAGWRATNEKFLQNVSWLNDLKLRASYGILGSEQNVNASNAFTLFGGSFADAYYDIGGTSNSIVQGFYQTRNGNPNTSWEENVVTNVGFDATLFGSKLDVSFEVYKKSINGLLFPQPLPATAGNAAPPVINIGDIQNKGWDFSGFYHGKASQDFKYNIGVNLTTYKNLVVKIPDPGYFDVSDSRIGNLIRNKVGNPVGSFYGYKVVGLFKDDADVAKSATQTDAAPGRFKYLDVNNDGEISPDDRT
ncbi:MAG TPA: TonB-dependent receptor, partial [Niastella sp.]|nr:TonB-dependent receptor [Niastella sp.]